MNPPPSSTFNLEEEEELPYGTFRRKSFFDDYPYVTKIAYGIFFVATFAFALSALILIAQVQNEVKDINPITSSSSDISSIMDYIISNGETLGCFESYTVSAIATCERECNREFCSGDFASDDVCRGACYPISGATLEDCKAACACCELNTNCLLKNSNDKEKCSEELAQCSHFTQPSEPLSHPVSDVCYSLFGMCRRTNFGFNDPIKCS